MSDRVWKALRTCALAALVGGIGLPAMSQVTETPEGDEVAGEAVGPTVEPIREYVKALQKSGALRYMTADQVIQALRDKELIGGSDLDVATQIRFARYVVRNAKNAKMGDLEIYVPPSGQLGLTSSETEPNNTTATANPVFCGDVVSGALSPAADVDYYTFTLAAPSDLQIFTTTSIDTQIDLIAGDGTTLIETDDDSGDGLGSAIGRVAQAAGTYFIKVFPFGAATGAYTVTLLCPAFPLEVEGNDTTATATATSCATGGGTGDITLAADVDYWSFTIAGSTSVSGLLLPAPDNRNNTLQLYDSGGTLLATNTDSGSNVGGRIGPLLLTAAGTYYWRASSTTAATHYNLTFSCSAVTCTNSETEPNGSFATANVVAAPILIDCATILPAADNDYFTFTLASAAVVSGRIGPFPSTTLDTILELYNSTPTLIASNDDCNGATDRTSCINNVFVAAGTYSFRVRHFSTSATATYRLDISAAACANPESELNDSFATANPIVVPGVVDCASISPAADNDYYSFTLGGLTSVTATTGPTTGADTVLTLYDSAFVQLDENDNAPGGTHSSITRVLSAGSYFYRVRTLGALAFNYSLTTTAIPCAGAESEPNNTVATANPVALPVLIDCLNISPAADLDYFTFTLSSAGVVSMRTGPNPSTVPDTVVALYDSAVTLIVENDDCNFPTDFTSCWSVLLSPGTYTVRVRAFSAGQTFGYTMSLGFAACPPTDVEPNDSFATATPMTVPLVGGGGAILPAGDNDYYSFTAAQTLQLVATTGPSPNTDTILTLYDSGFVQLGQNDDCVPGTDFTSCLTSIVPPGSYFYRVEAFSLIDTFCYDLNISATCPGGGTLTEIEPNDSMATAQAVNCGDGICSSITPATDVDYYVLTPGSQTQATFLTAGDPGGDTVITVYNAAGSEIGHNDDTPGGPDFYSTCIVPCLAGGSNVFIKVTSFGALAPIANLTMEVAACVLTTDVVEIEPNGTNATATNMGNAPVRGCGTAGAAAADVDLMRFTLLADSLVTIDNGPANADLSLRLFLPTGPTIVFENTNGAPGGSVFTLGLRAGSYINRARSKFGNSPAQNWFMDILDAAPTDVELEVNGTVALASPLNCNQTLSCSILENLTVGGDLDYYSFTIPAGPSQPIALFTGPSTADTNLTLIDTNGTTVLAFNEDIDLANGNVAAEIDTTLAPGTYFVLAQGHIGSAQVPSVPYTLSLLCPTGNVESEDNSLPATADAGLDCGVTVEGRIGALGDVDYWSFNLVTEQIVSIVVGAGSNSTNVAIIDTDGVTVLGSSGTNAASAALFPGNYFVRVTGLSTAGYSYMCNANCVAAPQPVDMEPNDNRATANASACTDNKVGLLMPRDTDLDYWSFTTSQWSLVTLTVDIPDSRSSVDPFIRIVDALGNPLRPDDNSAGGKNARVKINVPPGTWYAAVTSNTDAGDPDPIPIKDLYELHIVCEPSQCASQNPICIDNGYNFNASINAARQTSCFTFTTTQPNTHVDIAATSATIEPNIFLTDGSNNYLDYDDDDGDDEAANLCATLPSAGEYRFRVQNFGQGVGSFTVRLKYTPDANVSESEPNDSRPTANPLANQDTAAGTLSSGTDFDYYRFTVQSPDPANPNRPTGVTLLARSCAGHDNFPQQATDLALDLYDSGGAPLASQNLNNAPDADEQLQMELVGGTYFVAVSGTPGDTGQYDLNLKVSDFDILIEPTASTACGLRCSDPVGMHFVARNLLTDPPNPADRVGAYFELRVQLGNGPEVILIAPPVRHLPGGYVVDKTFTRTLAQWLAFAQVPLPCPTSGDGKFILLTIGKDSRNNNRTVEIARDEWHFTIRP